MALRRPLKVELAPGDEVPVTAFAPAIGVWGCGNTIEAAFRELGQATHALHQNLESTPPESLDSSARELLSQLRVFLGR
ncbi:MAG: hypothetical protein V2A73_01690 [Pseudomonadota bacterium]